MESRPVSPQLAELSSSPSSSGGGPIISVVMPLYNREKTIARAIDSVLAQSFVDFELIVVDDGSTDRSVDVVAGIVDPRLRLVRVPANRGANAARNQGIRRAQ